MELSGKHEFALHFPVSSFIQNKKIGEVISFSDEEFIHRIKNVLRFSVEDTVILFDRHYSVIFSLLTLEKKVVSGLIISLHPVSSSDHDVTFLLPLLKRDDFEAALYALTEIGVSSIQLVETAKGRAKALFANKDKERAERIIVAAAEQSKNFCYPVLHQPIPLERALGKQADIKIFFDEKGEHLFSLAQRINALPKRKSIMLFVGPEGDLVDHEKRMAQESGFVFCALTTTILRAVQAASVGAGAVCSLLR